MSPRFNGATTATWSDRLKFSVASKQSLAVKKENNPLFVRNCQLKISKKKRET